MGKYLPLSKLWTILQRADLLARFKQKLQWNILLQSREATSIWVFRSPRWSNRQPFQINLWLLFPTWNWLLCETSSTSPDGILKEVTYGKLLLKHLRKVKRGIISETSIAQCLLPMNQINIREGLSGIIEANTLNSVFWNSPCPIVGITNHM